MEKNKVIVKIRNKEYVIMSSDPQEYILSVANELDARIKDLAVTNSALHPERLVILASLNLCDEYIKLKENNKVLQQQLTNCTNELEKCLGQSSEVSVDEKLKEELDTANERIRLLESKLSDDDKLLREIADLKDKILKCENEKTHMKQEYDKQIENLKTEFSKKENEFLEMIDKM